MPKRRRPVTIDITIDPAEFRRRCTARDRRVIDDLNALGRLFGSKSRMAKEMAAAAKVGEAQLAAVESK